MEQLSRVSGIAAPLMRPNIDTDQIIPGKELVRVHTEGYARSLFANWRYRSEREPDPAFILNQEPWRQATILISGRNFGCGSSREAAPKALREFGFRAIIAPSFGGIFYNNAFRNGIVLVELAADCVDEIASAIETDGGRTPLEVDLQACLVTSPSRQEYSFSVPEIFRQMLLKGVDEIDLTLENSPQIDSFRRKDRKRRPWAY